MLVVLLVKQLIQKYKTGNYIYFADNLYMPYGTKDKSFVKNRVEEIIEFLKKEYKVKKHDKRTEIHRISVLICFTLSF